MIRASARPSASGQRPSTIMVPMAMSMIFNVVLLPKCGGTYNQAFLSAACNITLIVAAGIGTAAGLSAVFPAFDKPENLCRHQKV